MYLYDNRSMPRLPGVRPLGRRVGAQQIATSVEEHHTRAELTDADPDLTCDQVTGQHEFDDQSAVREHSAAEHS